MQDIFKKLAFLSALVLASCGDGGSGSAPTNPPIPTPTPTPTPTPPPAATARVYATSLATGLIEFTTGDIDTFGNYLTLGFTARDGRYYPGHANAIAAYKQLGSGSNPDPAGDYALSFKRTQVVDHETGQIIHMNAPANVRMVTPVTAMLVAPGSTPEKLKTQLGMNNGVFSMASDPNLATYDAITEAESGNAARVADAARMHAANLRVLVITSAIIAIQGGALYNVPEGDRSFGDERPASSPLEAVGARCLAARPAEFVFQNDQMTPVVKCFVDAINLPGRTPAKQQAIAHLINVYAAAIPARLESPAEKARWLLGINGYLRPMIGRIVADQTDTFERAALLVQTPTIATETSRYSEYYRYNETGIYMPSPDFVFIEGTATTITVRAESLTANDVIFSNVNINTRGLDRPGGVIQSVSVPAANANQISVTSNANATYTVTALNGFKGVSYFDYVAKASNNEEQTTRVYVRVW